MPTDRLFTGQRLDDTGLYYYGARYYDPQIGRFISADTIVPDPAYPQALNRYSYCLNNPLKYNDPSGHWWSWSDIRDFAVAFFESFADYFSSMNEMANNPIITTVKTVKETVEALIHHEDTLNAIKDHYNPSTPTGIGHITADSAWAIVTFIAGVAANASKASSVTKVSTSTINTTESATGRIFWSGGLKARNAAEQWMSKNKGTTTLERTAKGRHLEEIGPTLSHTERTDAWISASREFAKGATGEVHVFQDSMGVRMGSVWATVEYPQLVNNLTVTITFHIVP